MVTKTVILTRALLTIRSSKGLLHDAFPPVSMRNGWVANEGDVFQPTPLPTPDASFNTDPLYCVKFTKRLISPAAWLSRPTARPPAPGWCQYKRPPKACAQQVVWSCCLAPKRLTVPFVWTHEPRLRGLCCCCCLLPCSSAAAAPS